MGACARGRRPVYSTVYRARSYTCHRCVMSAVGARGALCYLVITPAADGARGGLQAKRIALASEWLGLELGLGVGLGVGAADRGPREWASRYRRGVRGAWWFLTPPPLLSSPRRVWSCISMWAKLKLAGFRSRRCYRRECLCRTVQNRRLDLITISSPANLALDAAAKRQRGLRALFPPLPPEHRCVSA